MDESSQEKEEENVEQGFGCGSQQRQLDQQGRNMEGESGVGVQGRACEKELMEAEDMSCKEGDRDGTEEEKQEGYNRRERGWQSRAGIERMETGGGTGERESDDDTPIILCAPKGPDNVQGGRVGGVGGAASHSVDTNAWELEREDQDGDESLRGDGMPGDVVQVEQLVASQDEDDDDLSLTERQARLQRFVLMCVRAHALQYRSALRPCWAWELSNNGV